MEVRRAGHQQAQLHGQRPDVFALFGGVVLVVGLQTREAGRGQLDDERVGHDPAAYRGARMGEDRYPAGRADQLDRAKDVDVRLRNPVPPAEPL